MKQTSTHFLRRTRGTWSVGSLILLLISLLATSSSYAQTWCTSTHGQTCASSYPVLGSVTIKQGAKTIFSKPNDGCNGGASMFNVITSTPAFTLNAGSTYTLEVGMTTYYSYSTGKVGAWIDLNRDGDFSDAGEFLSQGWSDFPMLPNTGTSNFTINCNNVSAGTTRLRLRSTYPYDAPYNSSDACGYRYYGETEDYTITLAVPTTVSANFFAPDTAFVGTVVKFINSNATGYVGHEWDLNDDGAIESYSTDYKHVFASAGTYSVRLKSQNCKGRDSIAKNIVIVNPTKKPVADFLSDKNVVQIYDYISLSDLSENGPTYWKWEVFDPNTNYSLDPFMFPELEGGDPNINQNPTIYIDVEGSYTVCLNATNSIDSSGRRCKADYIKVTSQNNIWWTAEPSTTAPSGNLFDQGGPNGNYANNASSNMVIKPCGASTVSINFSQFKLNTGEAFYIWDGLDAAGIPLHPLGGFTKNNPLILNKDYTGNSGALFIRFLGDGSGVDSGFAAKWSSVIGATTPPSPAFSAPDTIYNSVWTRFTNATPNLKGELTYQWTLDGNPISSSKDLDYIFSTDGYYVLGLEVTSCNGYGAVSDTIQVITPHIKTDIDFTASDRRPSAGATVKLKSKTNRANRWVWDIFPSSYTIVGGQGTEELTVQFLNNAAYTITLKAWNYLDSANTYAKLIKDDYVIVTQYCNPTITQQSTTADLGISRVTLERGNTVLMSNNSDAGSASGYTDFGGDVDPVTLNYGVKYKVTVARPTNMNEINRRVWIDYNIDGDFTDANETVAAEVTSTDSVFSYEFTVPDLANAFEGRTRMRVGSSYRFDDNQPCGGLSHPNANRVGEFEDYAIILANDGQPPVLSLIGMDTIRIEVNTSFTDPGAIANDPNEGDISTRIVKSSDVDNTLPGIYTITYNVSDASGNPAAPITRMVFVVLDKTAPVLTLIGLDTVTVDVFSSYTELGATAQDNRDGNITTAIVRIGQADTSIVGDYEITYIVSDAQGNEISKKRLVRVVDREAPVINALGSDNVQINSTFFDQTTVTDNYWPHVELEKNGPEVNINSPGIYTIVYSATDSSGNVATPVTRHYRVDDFTKPVIELGTPDTVVIEVHSVATYIDQAPYYYDEYYSVAGIAFFTVGDKAVNVHKLGTYKITYTATDLSGNTTSKDKFVKVVDTQKPTIFGASINVRTGEQFNALEGLIIWDNYDSAGALRGNITQVSNVNIWFEGTYSIVYRVSDLSGNISDPFTRLVNVGDNLQTSTGVKTVAADAFSLYPNPAVNQVVVEMKSGVKAESVGVYNTAGVLVKTVATISGNKIEIDVTDLAGGIYMVRMNTATSVYTQKLVINK